MVAVPFTDSLNSILYVITQSLLIPVVVILLAFLAFSVVAIGGLISEYSNRTKIDVKKIGKMILAISHEKDHEKIINQINGLNILPRHKDILISLVNTPDLGPESREALARKLIENEEILAAKKLEKTDIVAKIAPAIGLMGTLIPLGPGLAALGTGDVQNLSQHLIIAFDSAVMGMAAASIGFTISKIRRRWYEEEISNLETVAEALLEVLKS